MTIDSVSAIRRLLAALLAAGLVLAACGTDTPEETAPPEDDAPQAENGADDEETPDDDAADDDADGDDPAGAPASGQLVIDKSFDQQSGDPHMDRSPMGSMVFNPVFESLLTFETTDVSEPDLLLAESMDVNDDATEFTFTLHDDIEFADGTPLTSADVVFSFERLRNMRGPSHHMIEGISVSAPDDYTVVLTTEEPTPAVPFIVSRPTFGVVNSQLVMENGGTDAEDADEVDEAEAWFNGGSVGAGTGPYEVERFSTTDEIVLVANPNYRGDSPAYERIVFRNAESAAQRLNVLSGESQVALDLSSDDIGGLEDQGLNVEIGTSMAVWYMQATADPEVSEVSSDPDFWEAVRYAIDYDGLLEIAGEGAVQACGIIPRQVIGALDEDECVERDLDRAMEALERTGLDDFTVDLEFPTDFFLDGISFGAVAERVQASLAEVGINAELRGAPLATSLDRWREGLNQMGQWSVTIPYPDPSAQLIFVPGGVNALRANWDVGDYPELEALAQEASQTAGDERIEMYEDIQRMLNEHSPIFPQMQAPKPIVADPSVGGIELHPAFMLDLARLAPQ